MINKRGYFGIGIENMKYSINWGTLWRSCMNLGADFMFTIGSRCERQSSDTVKAFRHIPLFEFDSIDDFKTPYSCKLIGVEIDDTARDLTNYIHPQRACYLLGAEDHGLTKEALKRCHDLIKIESNFCMNVSVTGSIIMYDRMSKLRFG